PSLPYPLLRCFFTPPPSTELYTLSLHDALPIFRPGHVLRDGGPGAGCQHAAAPRLASRRRIRARGRRIASILPRQGRRGAGCGADRKSTRLNSSHVKISYAVFCLKKKKTSMTST